MANVNGFEGTPFSVDGAEHPASLLRRAAFAFTNGAEGIVSAGDLKVSQLGPAGTGVQISAGGVLIPNNSPGGQRQSYLAVANTVSKLDVASNLTNAVRYDLVAVRVEDPEFGPFDGPGTDEEALHWQYAVPFIIQNVPASVRRWADMLLDYSAYALARIAIPGQTATILDTHLLNLRRVARPQYDKFYDTAVGPGSTQNLVSGPWGPWATAADKQVYVPPFATKAIIRTIIGGLQVNPGPTWGNTRMRLGASNQAGTVTTAPVYYDYNTPLDNNIDSDQLITGGAVDVPAALRGKTVYLGIEGMKEGGSTSIGVNSKSTIFTEVDWIEAAA